jgi:hypothetical protein
MNILNGSLPYRHDEYFLSGYQVKIMLETIEPLLQFSIYVDGELKDDNCLEAPHLRVRDILGL